MTAPLPDAVGVVERLLARKGMYQMTGDSGWKVASWADADCQEAADVIQSQAARIAELEAERDADQEAWVFVSTTLYPEGLLKAADVAERHALKELAEGLRMMAVNERAVESRAWERQARSLLSEGEGLVHSAASGSVPSRGSDTPAAPGKVRP